jgi:predicted secreted protein
MADKITGRNIMLYWNNPNGSYFLNGGISEGTILTNAYYQLSSNKNVADASNFTLTNSGTIARFITDEGKPGLTSISGGTWTMQFYASITTDVTSSPAVYFKISKYNGTTLNEIVSSSNVILTATTTTLYSTNITFPTTTLASNERIVIEVISINIGTRSVTFYTQGNNVAQIVTTLPVSVPFACSTNCTFSVQVGQKEVTSQTSAWYKEFKNDIASWSVTADGLITISGFNYTNMLALQQSRESIYISFSVDNVQDGFTVISGKCNLTSLQLSGPYKDIATYSISLQGSGAYVVTGTQPSSGSIVVRNGLLYNQEYVATGGETTVTFIAMVGRNCVYVSRGGIDVREIITAGSPSSEQVLWNTNTGVLTFGRALEADEFIRGLFN